MPLLAGCETDEDFWRPYHALVGDQHPHHALRTTTTQTAADDARCRTAAAQREADARANGYSIELADQIYRGALLDCLAWVTAHPE